MSLLSKLCTVVDKRERDIDARLRSDLAKARTELAMARARRKAIQARAKLQHEIAETRRAAGHIALSERINAGLNQLSNFAARIERAEAGTRRRTTRAKHRKAAGRK